MADIVFSAILDQIKELPNLETICPYGHNEPMLDPLIWARLREIRDKFPDKRIELSTNGLLLCSWNLAYFIDYVDDRWISFHGIDKETYELNMGLPWQNGQRLRQIIKDRPTVDFVISIGLAGYTSEQVEDFWKDYDNVKIMSFIPRDRAGNIKSDACESFDNPPTVEYDCWRLNLFLAYNTQGHLIPCSNDLQERHRVGTYLMSMDEIMDEREDFRVFNRIGAKTICGRCENHA